MARKSIDVGGKSNEVTGDMAPRKTERSHEENQERAYIAASRRADRSIEARVQSARQASDIHKKRTGKGFRITEEIVRKEEMYEEEDDDMPRSIHLLTAHMQTPSAGMNTQVENYLVNRVAFSNAFAQANLAWRSNDINRAFANTFPNAHVPMAHPHNVMPPQPQGTMPPQSGQHFHQMPNSPLYHQHPPDGFPSTLYSPPIYSPTPPPAPYSPEPYSPASYSSGVQGQGPHSPAMVPPGSYSPASYSSGVQGPGPHSPAMAPPGSFCQDMTSPPDSPDMPGRSSFSSGVSSPMHVMTPDCGTAPLAQSSNSRPPSIPPQSRKNSGRRRPQPIPSPPHARRRRASQRASRPVKRRSNSPSSAPTFASTTPSRTTPLGMAEQTLPFGSAFSSELPPEARMLLGGVGADDTLNQTLANQGAMNQQNDLAEAWMQSIFAYSPSSMPRTAQMEMADSGLLQDALTNPPTADLMSSNGAVSAAPGDDDGWRTFINENMWNLDQQ